ncbi:MAG: phosphoglycerate kinase [Candidatus Methylarchaceae archaeon HK02M1]|nr:phosphoglycerate kinase [Candidatus Methylarchaceae archaeon HK02M1]
MKLLAIDDLNLEDETVFVRVDLNTPIDPNTGGLMEKERIKEAAVTIRDLDCAKVVLASHQGRVGRPDYISLEPHATILSEILGKEVKFTEDIFGPTARWEIANLKKGEVLLLDNLRFIAEENKEFKPEQAAKTVFVQRLYKLFNACILDAFPTAHRAHPSIVGFSYILPTCGGRLVVKELKALNRVTTAAKGPFITALGGSKVTDRMEAIEALINNNRADEVLLSGLIANIFFKAMDKIKYKLGISGEDEIIEKARSLLAMYPQTFELPQDVAVERSGERVEISVNELGKDEVILDIGSKTIDSYSRVIRSGGTIFMSGPAGVFEKSGFEVGTEGLLRAMASSLGTTIVSGGHLTTALQKFGIKEWIDYASTAGGALVLYLAGKRLPLIDALERAAERVEK